MTAHTPLRPSPTAASVAAALAAVLSVIGCQDDSAPTNSEISSQPRLVSLSPAVTQMIRDLGGGGHIVGVGEYDPVAPDDARIVGDLRSIDYEALLALEPTAVLIQPGHAGVPGRLETLAGRVGFAIHRFDIETLDDALAALAGGVGEAMGDPDGAAALADRVRGQMAELGELTAEKDRPRVLLLVGLTPYATGAGPGTFLDEALEAAGARNALSEGAILYPELDHERLLAIDPDLMAHLTSHPSRQEPLLPGDLADRLVVLQHPAALLPSTALAAVTAELIALIHEDLAQEAAAVVAPAAPDHPARPSPAGGDRSRAATERPAPAGGGR